ncbi:uncharacterized protein Bif isoform X2 [Anoplolepis gracilipes]|uniref:uncharacterized protein Bif isoform X2 n=1 Tax=Anoplolepis gracilipes TaxID=354296 RepID=UPI003BA34E80
MATAGSNANAGNEAANGSNNVPQWKRDLIQRRRQQSKVLANNGASVKLCNAVIGTSATASPADSVVEQNVATVQEHCSIAGTLRSTQRLTAAATTTTTTTTTTTGSDDTATVATVAVSGAGGSDGGGSGGAGNNASNALPSPSSLYLARRPPTSGAAGGAAATVADFASSVAYNMRLEADLSLCSDAEDVVNGAPNKFTDERKFSDYTGDENEETASRTPDGKLVRTIARMNNESNASQRGEVRAIVTGRGKDILGGNIRTLKELPPPTSGRRHVSGEDAESDSSEELQYGPGIVNKLKSKYLNLTLRETNKSRVSVQRFRRAASLEDLLDRDDDEASSQEKQISAIGRKYTKRNGGSTSGGGVIAPKTDRYRNATRGNDSMKRARSVETLMRYNSVTTDEPVIRQLVPVARPATNGVRQEPVNDHIILVDRTSVKIESRLGELERPKPINKPKRIKPVLAETERPPPDLVKTTMRIFESSAKKVKPKGEVAVKVATFKTINDTFKAQKKLMPKPPIQPKPFVNGGPRTASGGLGSPKKIVLPHKPTKLIETQDNKEECHVEGVITEPIAQSVSSVVSKFQQIEKSHSPSPSPEPSCYKLKFSPANSPEPPQVCKSKSAVLEIVVKSPPVTPVLSPRLQSPPSPIKDARQGSQSPSSPVKDSIRVQISNPLHKPPLPSPVKESSKTSESESFKVLRLQIEKEPSRTNVESPESFVKTERKEDAKLSRVTPNDDEEEEIVDGPRTISKIALDNIGRAGITMQFNFGDKSTTDKSYLPGAKQNGQRSADERVPEDDCCAKTESRSKAIISSDAPAGIVMTSETTYRLQERLGSEAREKLDDGKEDVEEKLIVPESKPIGAICSLGLIKTTAYPQSNNEAKTIRCQQKSEFSPPQKQIGIIRPLVSTQKTQHPQQNLSNRELEKNLINRVKSIEQPTKVVVSLKSADEIQPTKKTNAGGGGGLWDTRPWNQQNNTMVFNFSNRKDVPDYIENDGLIIRRKREKPKVGDGGIIVLDATLDASTTDDAEWEISGGPPSPCDVSFLNDNVLINGRSNLSRTPRNHKHRIQFDDTATRTFEYPSEASILEGETSSVDGETSGSIEQQSTPGNNKTSSTTSSTTTSGGGLASYTPSKVDLTSEGFELGITRAVPMVVSTPTATGQTENASDVEYLRPAQDAGAWGSETTGDLLY